MQNFYTVETIIAATFYGLSFLLYLKLKPWRSALGRVLLAVLFCLATVLALVSGSLLLGPYPGREIARVLVYTLTMISGIIIFLSILIGQIKGSRERTFEVEPTLPPTTSTKAIVAAVASGAVAVIASLVTGLDDDVLTTAEWLTAVGAGIVASGLTGVTTWAVPNRPKA